MKTIEVVAAIIHQQGRILATQRGYGEHKGIRVERKVCTVEYDYPNFHLTMHCYWCSIEQGELVLNEHQSASWLEKSEWESVEWLPADIEVVKELQKYQC